MIEVIYIVRKQQRRRTRVKKVMVMALLLKLKFYLKDRNFLRSAALFPSVREAPWYVLYREGCDSDLLSATSLTRSSFEYLLSRFKLFYKFKSGPSKRGRPPRVKDHHCVLSLLLHSYCSPAEKKTWSEMFGIAPSTLSRTLIKAEKALLLALNATKEADVVWPTKADQVRMALLVEKKVSYILLIIFIQMISNWTFLQEPLLKGRWGFIDGKNYTVQEPGNAFLQNCLYNSWLHQALITGTTCFSVDGVIIWAKLNYFGSWNDSEMSRSFREKLSDPARNVDGHGVLSDSAFPVSKEMFGRIMTPLKDGDIERAHRAARPTLTRLSTSITSMRQAAEWGMGAVSKVYRILLNKLSYDKERRGRLLIVTHKLYNFRVRTTGISQIRNYFY